MAAALRAARLCHRAGRTVSSSPTAGLGRTGPASLSARRRFVFTATGNNVQFRLDERTAHSSLDLFKKDTGIIYRMLGLDPSKVQDNPERFRDWAVVLGDERIGGGRHYWEVTVKKSQEFRLGVAEASMSRDDCVGTNGASWVFGYARRKWFAMTGNKMVPVTQVGKADRVGILLDYEAGLLALVDVEKPRIVHSIKAPFRAPLCPAFGLWDGELLTHSGLQEPEGLK
ncbi:putative SPRY domain-containing protein 4 [Scophthalmus maximus]|uniref:Putative SPRY domain-containing protein 4 n=1 Tax=Scophthalmus maximus TaxID=52904 RepID=A0A2U9C5D9_SCOMX|nr:SPRY domain-containing protein 4 [Scophthalmus maximus]AWP10272.1 putative SPRY domain-containing protein 4 [Scophthalmus maximus]